MTTAITNFRSFMTTDKVKAAISRAAMGTDVNVDRMIEIVLYEVRKSPRLAECMTTKPGMVSIADACIEAVQAGLEPTGPIGGAYLVPFKGKARLMYAYQGLIDLARRSGEISEIYAEAVFGEDRFGYELGLNRSIVHEPYMDGDRGDVVAAYAVAKMKDGGLHMVVFSREDIERRRKASHGQGKSPSGPWGDWYDEMAKKTVIRQLSKLLPRSVRRFHKAIANEDASEFGGRRAESMDIVDITDDAETVDGEVVEETARTVHLKEHLEVE